MRSARLGSSASALVVPAAWLFLRPVTTLVAEEGRGLLENAFKDVPSVVWTGGAVIVLGVAAAFAKSLVDYLLDALRRQVTITVELDARDESFRWVLEWLAENDGAKKVRICVVFVAPVGRSHRGVLPPVRRLCGHGGHTSRCWCRTRVDSAI